MIKVGIVGAAGRMGRMLTALVLQDPELEMNAALEVPGCPLIGADVGSIAGEKPCGVEITDMRSQFLTDCDAIIDFSAASGVLKTAVAAVAEGVNIVIGTTGLSDEDKQQLHLLVDKGAHIVFAPNMSVGVNVLFALSDRVARLLGDDYDIEVVEMHHNKKKDAPSGTAERLGEILAEARGLDYKKAVRHGRVGLPGARTKEEIGMHSLRGGDVVGDHTVIFATDGERIELTHKASSRQTFAKGALRAVKFLSTAKSGIYDMQDVLGLR
ncbi:MAG: 4-hydroxy-tetrahydrodipicolinate reductase [Lentisphaeria bacterium]